jgi:hypothetical protein
LESKFGSVKARFSENVICLLMLDRQLKVEITAEEITDLTEEAEIDLIEEVEIEGEILAIEDRVETETRVIEEKSNC